MHEGFDRYSPVYAGRLRQHRNRYGCGSLSTVLRYRRLLSCKAHGMKDADMLNPVMGDGRYASWLPSSPA